MSFKFYSNFRILVENENVTGAVTYGVTAKRMQSLVALYVIRLFDR